MSSQESPVKVAIVTGGHSFDVPNFHGLFRSLEGVDAYIQHMDDWASSPPEIRQAYDVTVFYIMLMETPPEEGLEWYRGDPRKAIGQLGETGQGILMLHHAILAYPGWPLWSEIVGIDDREFDYHLGQSVRVDVADGRHPITEGQAGWDMPDETYTMSEPSPDNRVLLTLDHPRSMKSIAWTREYQKARVFCFQSGHDNETWAQANFREILRRGIFWCAGRI